MPTAQQQHRPRHAIGIATRHKAHPQRFCKRDGLRSSSSSSSGIKGSEEDMFVIELDMVVCIVLRLDIIAAVGRLRRASVEEWLLAWWQKLGSVFSSFFDLGAL